MTITVVWQEAGVGLRQGGGIGRRSWTCEVNDSSHQLIGETGRSEKSFREKRCLRKKNAIEALSMG